MSNAETRPLRSNSEEESSEKNYHFQLVVRTIPGIKVHPFHFGILENGQFVPTDLRPSLATWDLPNMVTTGIFESDGYIKPDNPGRGMLESMLTLAMEWDSLDIYPNMLVFNIFSPAEESSDEK